MHRGPIRRAQLIAPFGVGAMTVVRDGTSLISAGLDHWFEREGEDTRAEPINIDEYRVEEWRLARLLEVDHFRLPPDHREWRRWASPPNSGLTVPFLRFPQWHFCQSCKRLEKRPLTDRTRKIRCAECQAKGRAAYMAQVPFVAMCDQGHIQDFPWKEWVHRSIAPTCNRPMRLIPTGAATLAGQKVVCECGKERVLAGIMEAWPEGNDIKTLLTEQLDESGRPFLCAGQRPWLGTEQRNACGRSIRGSLRNAANVYFAQLRSAIYLPRGEDASVSELTAMMEEPPLSTVIKLVSEAGAPIQPERLRSAYKHLLMPYSDEQISSAVEVVVSGAPSSAGTEEQELLDDDPETHFRRAEYRTLKSPREESELATRQVDVDQYDSEIPRYFSRIMLVTKLRETRVLTGFTRVFAENDQTLDHRKALMWNEVPTGRDSWLPAYVVFGEGIFLELREDRLAAWEQQSDVVARFAPLMDRYSRGQTQRRARLRRITPRFVLLHTLSHLLMNRLTFECGYSSAALRERLYVSDNAPAPMAGMLIYTAAGDAEGTMGGLVRMGRQGFLEPVLDKALNVARWCSADPVCMELGDSVGQGPGALNLAACHNCALVPETACEEFNRLLDRALVVGRMDAPGLGFFAL